MLALFRAQHYGIYAYPGKSLNDFLAPGFRQLVGKEAAIPDNYTHGHFLLGHKSFFILKGGNQAFPDSRLRSRAGEKRTE